MSNPYHVHVQENTNPPTNRSIQQRQTEEYALGLERERIREQMGADFEDTTHADRAHATRLRPFFRLQELREEKRANDWKEKIRKYEEEYRRKINEDKQWHSLLRTWREQKEKSERAVSTAAHGQIGAGSRMPEDVPPELRHLSDALVDRILTFREAKANYIKDQNNAVAYRKSLESQGQRMEYYTRRR